MSLIVASSSKVSQSQKKIEINNSQDVFENFTGFNSELRFRNGYNIITSTLVWERYKKRKFIFICNEQINQKSSI